MTPYNTGCTQVCNQGRDCTCAPQPCKTNRNKAERVVVDTEREQAAQDQWLALVRRSGAGAGVARGDEDKCATKKSIDWGEVILALMTILVLGLGIFAVWRGTPVEVAGAAVVVAAGIELIRRVLS